MAAERARQPETRADSECSLYERLLGDAFRSLPPVLREFHGAELDARAQGTLRVTRGPGRLRAWVADGLRLPRAASSAPLHLTVRPQGRGERWERRFGADLLVSRQWADGDLLVESFGLVRFGYCVHASREGLHFTFVRAWLWRVPLPLALSPRIEACAAVPEPGHATWRIQVRVRAPLLGELLRYEGTIYPYDHSRKH